MKLLGQLPKEVYLACSGGKDSMMALNFLLKGRRKVHVLYFNHNTKHGNDAKHFLHEFCELKNIPLSIGMYSGKDITEDAWRYARYEFFSIFNDKPIITVHHLEDNIETWLLSSIQGLSKFIPYSRDNVIRPFLLSSREDIDRYVTRHKLKWVEDPSNLENKYSRNKLRNQVLPVLRSINPGLEKTFYWKCVSKYEKDGLI